jgi:ubiquinone/menaquinone biosynthesis C-methylase UbiE
MAETERIQRIYDERAAAYDSSLGIVERHVLAPLRRAFGELLFGDTVEVAIGTGLNLPFYSAQVSRAVGVELSYPMLIQAKMRAEQLGLPFFAIQADASVLPFRDASFDSVAISLALCTIPKPATALMEMARVCRSGGRIVMLEHVLSSARTVAVVQRVLSPLQARSVGCHLDRETVQMAQSLGFTCDIMQSRLCNAVRLVVAEPPRSSRANLAAIR